MTQALFSTADYAAALAALRPRGRVWPGDPTSVQQQVLAAWAPTAEALDAAAQGVLVDAFPATSVALLTEWEESVGLAQADDGLTQAQRQAAVVTKLTAVGGQSKADMIAYAAGLGATISITNYATFRCGINTCGQPLHGPAWAYAWSISISANAGGLTPTEILSAIQDVAPAETTVFLV